MTTQSLNIRALIKRGNQMPASAAIIRLSELDSLPRKALIALAISASRDIDNGADKRDLLERLMTAIMKKAFTP